jgi:transcriptional regulator with XRE-family HTH domain
VQHDTDLESRLGISRAQISRVLNGKHDAGNQFIAGIIVRCGLEFAFSEVFEVQK